MSIFLDFVDFHRLLSILLVLFIAVIDMVGEMDLLFSYMVNNSNCCVV